uniref:FAM161 centrosomal protein B n=1 Tax=Paramormyrops kingsleyae TaxID=1676925 RepID=A0A3B3RC99_9TELE|nr:protein FAM161B [Paramormyrops kingsleyae]
MPVSPTMSYFNKPKTGEPFEEGQINTEDDSATERSPSANQDSDSEEMLKDNLLASQYLKGRSPAEWELLLQRRLEALQEAHRQQLQETGLLLCQELERRILHDSMVAAGNERKAKVNDQLCSSDSRHDVNRDPNCRAPRHEGPRRSSSLSDLNSAKEADSVAPTQRQISRRPFTASTARPQGTTVPKPFRMTLRETQRRSELLQTGVPPDAEKLLENKRQMEEMECQKKFHALPVPDHVFLPLYHNITEVREQARKASMAQRRHVLLSTQKPFSFLLREEKKREEKISAEAKGDTKGTSSSKVRWAIPKAAMDPGVSKRLIEEELHRKIRIQIRAQDMLRSSMAPIEVRPDTRDPETCSAQRTKKTVLGFLNEKPTFQPRTNLRVPDFDRLHRTFQKEALRRAEKKDVTRCQPFQLRTSALPPRQNQRSHEEPEVSSSKNPIRRSNSFSGITSLSSDTLPTYITDAVRKRCSAIRKSLEEKESKEWRSAAWMNEHRMKSQAMKKMVCTRARAMDPHRSLKEVFQEKLKQHREMDNQRMKEYRKELEEMKTRVKGRPYLFEQITQKNAKCDAEKRYRDTLLQAGLDEQFVRTKGEEAGDETSLLSHEEGDSIDDGPQYRKDTKETTDAEEEENEESTQSHE